MIYVPLVPDCRRCLPAWIVGTSAARWRLMFM